MTTRALALASSAALAALLVSFARPGPQDPASEGELVRAEEVVAELSWLAGSWSGPIHGGTFHAYYSTPEGGRVLSYSRLVHDGAEAFYEFEVFEPREGLVHLQPFPGGKKAGGFRMESHDAAARKAVFENPDKDFPTRIVYHRTSDDDLVITLTDPHGGSAKVETYALSR